MDCFHKGNKTGPEENHRTQRHCTPRRPKVNGWSWPPHPYQMLSWIAYLYFLIVIVGIFIPLLPSRWVPAGYIWFGVAFIWHLAFHVIAATIDPAEDSVLAKGYKRLLPVYQGKPLKSSLRKRYCPLCGVQVCVNSKHCNRCKKCVGNFDHHCKWLNNCVGGRNYRYFLSSVISAILGCLIIITISGFVFVGFFINPKLLRSNPKFGSCLYMSNEKKFKLWDLPRFLKKAASIMCYAITQDMTSSHFYHREGVVNNPNTWLVFLPYFSVHTNVTAILVLAVVTIGLSLTALIALCDLLFFHFYLMWNQLSTYEYILFHREQRVSKVSPQNDDLEASQWKSHQNAEKVASHQNSNTHVHVKSTSTNGSTSECHQDAVMIEDETLRTVASNPSQARIKKISQRKRRRKMSAGRRKHQAAVGTFKRPFKSSELPPALAVAFRSSVLSLQSMDYLSPLSVSTVWSMRAAGPPAEYHSDSAESMNEIPVVQTRLGSAAVAMQTSTTFHSTEDTFGNSLPSTISIECSNKRPVHPTTSKKSEDLDPSIEQFNRDPPLKDRNKNDEIPLPE